MTAGRSARFVTTTRAASVSISTCPPRASVFSPSSSEQSGEERASMSVSVVGSTNIAWFPTAPRGTQRNRRSFTFGSRAKSTALAPWRFRWLKSMRSAWRSSSSTQSMWPRHTARWSTPSPNKFCTLRSDPASMRRRSVSECPAPAAQCAAVLPAASVRRTSGMVCCSAVQSAPHCTSSSPDASCVTATSASKKCKRVAESPLAAASKSGAISDCLMVQATLK
mmetsp:Transcript_10398/g.32906  ORF Transcript_10398/g.32906 Transcript_10398/m.32906 type:complete len:223 (+) Transcript_10398:310-978(+)